MDDIDGNGHYAWADGLDDCSGDSKVERCMGRFPFLSNWTCRALELYHRRTLARPHYEHSLKGIPHAIPNLNP
jgi:hypothetical protein